MILLGNEHFGCDNCGLIFFDETEFLNAPPWDERQHHIPFWRARCKKCGLLGAWLHITGQPAPKMTFRLFLDRLRFSFWRK